MSKKRVAVNIKKAYSDKIGRMCEEFQLDPTLTLQMAVDVGISRIDAYFRYNHKLPGVKTTYDKLKTGNGDAR